MAFVKATKKKLKARVALVGPTGSGKTFTALRMARGLVGPDGRIAVLDTEHGSASKYVGDVADFDVQELTSYEPENYVNAIREAADAGYGCLVIDSLSHAWSGAGGLLDQKDKRSGGGGNSFDAWRHLTPQQNAMIDAILAAPIHIVATMRAKMEYLVERDSSGKTKVTKVGLAPVQRDSVEYEFDLIGDIDVEHTMHINKSRCSALQDKIIRKPGEDVARTLLAWLDDGVSRIDAVLALLEQATAETLDGVKQEALRVYRALPQAEKERLAAAVKATEARVRGGTTAVATNGAADAAEGS